MAGSVNRAWRCGGLITSRQPFVTTLAKAAHEGPQTELRFPPLPTISEIVRLYKLRARKHLSQNFVLDSNVSTKLVNCAGNLKGATVCEVGPGPGGLTRAILAAGVRELVVIEKDERFLPSLKLLREACGDERLRIFSGDVLQFDMSQLFDEDCVVPWSSDPPNIHLIGNLPFNVSTPLIVKWLQLISNRSGPWRYGRAKLTLTFQKEVAERIVAPVRHKQRSRLSVMCQNLCDVKIVYVLPAQVFVPAPKVDAGLVNFTPRSEPYIPEPFQLVEKVVKYAFQYRQKPCRKGFAPLFPEELSHLRPVLLSEAAVDPETKPQQLTMEHFKRLCGVYANMCEHNDGLLEYNFREPAAELRQRNFISSSVPENNSEIN